MAEPGPLVWITGASSGIGRALAIEMARDGWRVAATARRAEALQALADELPDGAVTPVPVDVTDADAVAAAIDRIERELGPVDCAVLAAGTYTPTPLDSFDLKASRAMVEVNLMGVMHAVAALAPRFGERRTGHLVVVSSVAGYRGLPNAATYGATKAALINLTESLKFDLDRWGVKTQLVCPGFVRTPLTDKNDFPMPFLMEVEDAARRLYRGMQGAAFEITFPRRFTVLMKKLAMLPYALYFPAVRRATRS